MACEDDLVWRLRHPLLVHGPGMAVELEKDATQADLAAAATTIDRLTAERNDLKEDCLRLHKEKMDFFDRAIEAENDRARLTAERDGFKAQADALNGDVWKLGAERDALQHDIERLRKALESVSEGDVPRPLGERYRSDGKPSKNDQCKHGLYMYQDCGNCISEFAAAALATLRVTDADGKGGQ